MSSAAKWHLRCVMRWASVRPATGAAAGSCNWDEARPGLVANSPGKCKSANIARIPARVGYWHAGARLIARLTAGKACRAGLMAESAIDPRGVSRNAW